MLPTHNPLRVAEHAATLDHMLGGRLNVAFVRGYQARWGGYLVLADTQAQAEAWAHDCLWLWDTWSVPFGQGHPPLLIGDADTVSRRIEAARRHVPCNEVFFLFGQGLLERDKCLKTLELFAEKVMPRFQD